MLVKSINNIISSTKKNIKKIPIFKTSCKTGNGLDIFANAIVEYYNSMKENEDIQNRQAVRYSRRIKTIIEKDILKNFWSENRLSLLEKIDKSSIKMKSPYKIVDEIKGEK